ncbi:MAG: prolyl oligopeptidase family serine peptidase [Flavobacteriaceae bacterium]
MKILKVYPMKFKALPLLLTTLFISTQFITSQQEEDPHIWLEDVEGEQPLDWVRAENAQTVEKLEAYPGFEHLREKYVLAFNDKDRIAFPTIVGDYVYNLWQDDVNERGLWRRMPQSSYLNKSEEWEIVLDLDKLSEEEDKKWVFAGATWLAPGNKYCLLSLSDGGTDENVIREFDAETKQFSKNGFEFKSSKGGASWVDHNKVMVYRNFGDGSLTASGYPRMVKLMQRGDELENAKTIFETDPEHVGVFGLSYYDAGKTHLFLYRMVTFWESELYYLVGDQFKQVDYPKDAQLQGFHKGQVVMSLQSDWEHDSTNYELGSLVSFDLNKNLEGQYDVNMLYIPDEKSSYVAMSGSKDFITVNIMEDVQNKLLRYRLEDGAWKGTLLETPTFGSINLMSSSNQTNDHFLLYSNFITPRTLYHADENGINLVKKLKDFFDASELVIDQHFATSSDGTSVPYFVVRHKDIVLNGKNPTLVYAYGGFGVSVQPNYSYTTGLGWLERGGVYVLANIRGGGEYGPAWHQAGRLENKQNCYNDFYAVTEDLINRKISSPEHIGAFGWSNGGLMAGVLYTQRPDLFNAVVIGAPLLDMKRYNKLLAGASWVGEYGDPDKEEDWAFIKKYSPYHNLKKSNVYPEVYFVTSTKDDRVHPGHARKMAAKMKTMGHPYWYYETIEGGHSAASTNKQQAFVMASIYSYLSSKLMTEPMPEIKD